MNTFVRRACLGAWLFVCCGCGSDGFTLAPVSGRVTVDGKPVAALQVSFEPVGSRDKPNPGPGSYGITDNDGRYTLVTLPAKRRGAVVGPCRVRIRTVIREEQPAANQFLDPPISKGKQPVRHLPLRFNDHSELTFEVAKGGTDSANFDLSWK